MYIDNKDSNYFKTDFIDSMNAERRKQFDKVYMKMALVFSSLSYAEKKKVGAIIVNSEDQIIAQGFNGTPRGFDNTCEDKWCERYDKKVADVFDTCPERTQEPLNLCMSCQYRKLKTKPEVLHAEPNAIMKCIGDGVSTKNSTMYVTLSPCIDCAKLILQAGISRVVYYEHYRKSDGIDFLKKAGISVEQLNDLD